MYFRVNAGTETFKKLKQLKKKIDTVEKQARCFVKTINGTGGYCKKRGSIAGGVDAIEFTEKPEGWKMVGEKYQFLYMPKADKKNNDLWKRIKELPVVKYEELNDIVGFRGPQTFSSDQGIGWVNTVGVEFGNKYILIEVAKGCEFKPQKDVFEILESEYLKLKPKEK